MIEPAEFERRALIAVVGLTPQVVTETLYALIVARRVPFVPTDIHLITTTEGAQRAALQLLDDESGALPAFARDYCPALSDVVGKTRITLVEDADGRPLTDVAHADDGMAMADRILQIVRAATADAGCAIYASIAGGRKTMGFLLGYAMSLFGRPQDRLTHVLVNAPFQDHPDFFYPPPRPRVLFGKHDSRPARTDAARIVLTEIPFVRLRSGLPIRLLDGAASFTETVAEAQDVLTPASLVLDVRQRALVCQGRRLVLAPVEFAFVLWLARRRLAGTPNGGALSWRESSAEEFLAVYESLGAGAGPTKRVREALRDGVAKEWFEQRIARINKLVKDALGLLAPAYAFSAQGRRPQTRYGLSDGLGSISILE